MRLYDGESLELLESGLNLPEKTWQPSQPQKRCLIAHLSAPQGQSVNNGLKRFVNKVEMKPASVKKM